MSDRDIVREALAANQITILIAGAVVDSEHSGVVVPSPIDPEDVLTFLKHIRDNSPDEKAVEAGIGRVWARGPETYWEPEIQEFMIHLITRLEEIADV